LAFPPGAALPAQLIPLARATDFHEDNAMDGAGHLSSMMRG
jgi:hypothetical protein